jgi:hypothetical protein
VIQTGVLPGQQRAQTQKNPIAKMGHPRSAGLDFLEHGVGLLKEHDGRHLGIPERDNPRGAPAEDGARNTPAARRRCERHSKAPVQAVAIAQDW